MPQTTTNRGRALLTTPDHQYDADIDGGVALAAVINAAWVKIGDNLGVKWSGTQTVANGAYIDVVHSFGQPLAALEYFIHDSTGAQKSKDTIATQFTISAPDNNTLRVTNSSGGSLTFFVTVLPYKIKDLDLSQIRTVSGEASKFISRDASGVPEATKAVPSGAVLGDTDTQSVSNKTLGNTNTITVKANLLTVQDQTDTAKQFQWDLSALSAGTLTAKPPTSTGQTLATLAGTESLSNKTLPSPTITTAAIFSAGAESRYYRADGTKYVGFKASASATTDTIWTLPVADGTSGYVLSTNGSGVLSWVAALSNPMTTTGDIIYSSSGTGTPARLAIGSANYVLKTDGSTPSWGLLVNANIDAAAAIAGSKIAEATSTTAGVVNKMQKYSGSAFETLTYPGGGRNGDSFSSGNVRLVQVSSGLFLYFQGSMVVAAENARTTYIISKTSGVTWPAGTPAVTPIYTGGGVYYSGGNGCACGVKVDTTSSAITFTVEFISLSGTGTSQTVTIGACVFIPVS